MENLCQEKSIRIDYFFDDPVTASDGELRCGGEMKGMGVSQMGVGGGVNAAYTCAFDGLS